MRPHLPASALEVLLDPAGLLFVEHKDQDPVLAAAVVLAQQLDEPPLPGLRLDDLHNLQNARG